MTLTNRLTVGSLLALASVLAGFSAAIYWTAQSHLHRRAEEQLASASQVLVASCEIKPDGVEWEAEERRLGFGSGSDPGGVEWLVTDGDDGAVDQSAGGQKLVGVSKQMRVGKETLIRLRDESGLTLVRQETISGTPGIPFSTPTGNHRKFPSLVVTASLSVEPIRATLNQLATTLLLVSLGIWFIAALSARRVCRWALRPVIRMAQAAGGITVTDLSARLPVPATQDELADLGAAFNDLLSRVEQAYVRQRSFTAEASHQLRTPIAAMIGQSEVALRRERDPAEYRRVLDSILRQGDRLRRVVEALLFLARSESDTVLPERKSIQADAWLSKHLRERWGSHSRFDDLRVEAMPVRASINPVLMGELVDVLVDNALKYSQGGTAVNIRVRSQGGMELIVEDHGPGLSEQDQATAFEPFVRAASARLQGVEGTGLGLAVARRIAVAHGGTLRVASTLGTGTRFTFHLPDGQSPPVA